MLENGSGNKVLSKLNVPLIKEDNGKVQYGKLLAKESQNLLVENQKTGKKDIWSAKDKNVYGVDQYIQKKEKQLGIASKVISYLCEVNKSLKKENAELKDQLDYQA